MSNLLKVSAIVFSLSTTNQAETMLYLPRVSTLLLRVSILQMVGEDLFFILVVVIPTGHVLLSEGCYPPYLVVKIHRKEKLKGEGTRGYGYNKDKTNSLEEHSTTNQD